MILSRFFLTQEYWYRTKRRDGTEDLLVLPVDLELEVKRIEQKLAICILPGSDRPGTLQFEIPIDSIQERRYETRLIDTRPLISSGIFVRPTTKEG